MGYQVNFNLAGRAITNLRTFSTQDHEPCTRQCWASTLHVYSLQHKSYHIGFLMLCLPTPCSRSRKQFGRDHTFCGKKRKGHVHELLTIQEACNELPLCTTHQSYCRSGNFGVAFFFRVGNVRVLNFHRMAKWQNCHVLQSACVRNFRMFNFCHPSNWRKIFSSENFPIYGI